MNSYKYLFPVLGLAVSANANAASPAKHSIPQQQPNVLFVLLDDLAYDAIENTGRYPFLRTPNINRLQEQGTTFNNYFCTMSLSSPGRACLLTGMYPHKHGVTQNHPRVEADWDTYNPVSCFLQKAGYETAHIGKIHMSLRAGKDQIRPGYDYWLSFRGQGEYYNNTLNENGREFQEAGYITDVLTDYAKDWLVNKREHKEKPFFMCLWHKAVHGPFTAAERHKGCYQKEQLPEPPNGNGCETFEGKPEWQKYKKTFYKIWDRDPEWNPDFGEPKNILETVLAVDESLGEMMKTLKKLGQDQNTIIIFSSDNGYFMGEHGFWDKRIAYDECLRIPLIIYNPMAENAPEEIDEMCLNIDVMPTLLEYAGVKVPEYVQGKSFKALLDGEKVDSWRHSFLFEYYVDDEYPYAGPTQLAVRTDRYKYVDALPFEEMDELYDLENDPGEMHNLIDNPDYAMVLASMQKELERLKIETEFNYDRDWWLRRQIPLHKAKYPKLVK